MQFVASWEQTEPWAMSIAPHGWQSQPMGAFSLGQVAIVHTGNRSLICHNFHGNLITGYTVQGRYKLNKYAMLVYVQLVLSASGISFRSNTEYRFKVFQRQMAPVSAYLNTYSCRVRAHARIKLWSSTGSWIKICSNLVSTHFDSVTTINIKQIINKEKDTLFYKKVVLLIVLPFPLQIAQLIRQKQISIRQTCQRISTSKIRKL